MGIGEGRVERGEKQIPPPQPARERTLRVGMTFLVLGRGATFGAIRHDESRA